MNRYLKAIQDELTGNLPFKMRDDAYTLIIGLGGSGVKYAGETKELLLKRYGEKEVAEKVDFYCLDTSDKDFPQNMNPTEVFKITGLSSDPWIDGWLNPDLLKRRQSGELKENSEGAGGVRMVGRWKLFSASPFIMQHIDTIINRYGKNIGQKEITKIFVIVMAGICGGTGCGTFIDIPYFVRKSMDAHKLPESLFDFYGMLELPDSKIDSSTGMDQSTKDKSRANAYAALKDLEYFMREDTGYTAKFQGYDEMFSTKSRIFNRCFLLSNNTIGIESRAKYNRNALDGSKAIYLDGAIPEAVNIMISSSDNKKDAKGNMFGFDSGMDNIRTGGFYPDENGKELLVSTFGASKIEIPMAEIVLAIFNRVFIGLKNRWELIEDRDLMRNVLKNKVLPVFRTSENFDLLMEIMDVSGIKETQLTSGSFVTDINARIKSLTASERYTTVIEKLRRDLKNLIDGLYLTHGPFFALKVFERDIYGASLDNSLSRIKPPSYNGNIAKSVKDYADFNPGLFKKDAKATMRNNLLDEITAYVKPKVFEVWEKQISDLKGEISREYHEGLFTRVTDMVKEMRSIFRDITKVDTYTQEQKIPDGTIFSWNFADVPWDQISEKINFLFTRKISIKKPGSSDITAIFTRGKIYPVEKGRANREKELFYWPKSDEKIHVVYYDDQRQEVEEENVVAIDEVMQFGNGIRTEVSIEDMIKKFLADIKNPGREIFTVILANFRDIIAVFNEIAFTDMIILGSPKIDLSQPVNALDDDTKKELFEAAIKKFKNFALPSFPVISDYIAKQLQTRHYAVTLEPEFAREYAEIIDNIRDGVIARDKTQKLTRNGLSIMISVNFYFDYPFEAYIEMKDCKAEYDKIKDTKQGAGLHIAEGAADNMRSKIAV